MDWKMIGSFILAGLGAIWGWYQKNKAKIAEIAAYIVKRVEQDMASGGEWTAEEKQALAWDLFSKELYPMLPWYMKLLPLPIWKKIIMALIDKICAKAKSLKEASAKIIAESEIK